MAYTGIVLFMVSSMIAIVASNASEMGTNSDMPEPFSRPLKLQSPLETGRDVIILQNLLQRHPRTRDITVTSKYDIQTAEMVQVFQAAVGLPSTGVFCKQTAAKVLDLLLYDRFKDDRKVPAGYKFKLYVPVHRDRTKETIAILLDAKAEPVYKFKVRAHGATNKDGTAVNQLTRNGNTPTGLATFDLNSKEPSKKSFGPYPVVRVVKGLEGNSAIGYGDDTLLSNYRSGILLHTGEWPNWNSSMPMPNSLGCIHCSPDDMKNVVDILHNKLGVVVNDNPFGKLPYPYKPQGLIAIEQID